MKTTTKFYFSGVGLGENPLVMTILCAKSDKDSPEIINLIRRLDQPSKKLIFKYPIDSKLIENETKLIDELKQIRTKLINKEKGEEKGGNLAQKKPSPQTKPVSCWSVLSLFRFSSGRT